MGYRMLSLSELAKPLQQSGIRAASTRCREMGGINLGQGICDINIIEPIKQAAKQAIDENKSIYSPCEGAFGLRQAIANKCQQFNGLTVNPANEVMVSHGATGAFVCAAKTLFNPGDEVIVFEPFYGYHRNILNLMHVTVKASPISMKDFSLDLDHLSTLITPKTKGMIICTPNNPTGKVYNKQELLELGEFALKHKLAIITDEIYEYITYPGYEHVSLASLSDAFKQQTITISGFSKTFNMTGWRLGYATGPAHIIEKMALIQDFLYVCPVTPLQHAGINALSVDDSYYQDLRQAFLNKRQLAVSTLTEMGFELVEPQGAYYILASSEKLNFGNGQQTVDYLMEHAKVATVAGSAFYVNPQDGANTVRFCYALDEAVLKQAFTQMSDLIIA